MSSPKESNNSSAGQEPAPGLHFGQRLYVFGKDRVPGYVVGGYAVYGATQSPAVTAISEVVGVAADLWFYNQNTKGTARAYWEKVVSEDTARGADPRSPELYRVRPRGPYGGVEYTSLADRREAGRLARLAREAVMGHFDEFRFDNNDLAAPSSQYTVPTRDGETTLFVGYHPLLAGRIKVVDLKSSEGPITRQVTYRREFSGIRPIATVVKGQETRTLPSGQETVKRAISIGEVTELQREIIVGLPSTRRR